MNNEISIFENPEFGKVRGALIDGEPWTIGKDVATALGYSNASKAVMNHVDDEDKRFMMMDFGADSQNGNVPMGQTKTTVINESGIYSLIFGSKLPKAKEFKRWVTSEVLPAIRKTGTYTNPQHSDVEPVLDYEKSRMVTAREKEIRIKAAHVWTQMAKASKDPNQRRVYLCRAEMELAGAVVTEFPALPEKTYSATEIGKELGISANMVGRIANKHGLKTAQYSTFVLDVAKGNPLKQVQTVRYYRSVVEAMRPYVDGKKAM